MRLSSALAAFLAEKIAHWDKRRHDIVQACLRRVFAKIEARLCEPGSLPHAGIHRVLICRPNHRLGNAVLLSPLIVEVEALYPGAEMDLLVAGHAAVELYAGRFHVRRIFCLPRRMARHPLTSLKLLRQLHAQHYDLAIDATRGSQSGRLLLALPRARFVLGYPNRELRQQGRDSAWFHLDWPLHHGQHGVFLLHQAQAEAVHRDGPRLNIALSASEKAEAREVLARLAPAGRMLLGVFCNATGGKCYSPAWWLQCLQTLNAACPNLSLIELVAEHGQSRLDACCTPFYTRNLRHLAAIIGAMDACISADCGVMHLAAASGTPTLGLFCVTDPARYAPYGGANAAIVTRDLDVAEVAAQVGDWLRRVQADAAPRETAGLPASGRPDLADA